MSVGRKVGHINIVGKSRSEARAKLAMIDQSGMDSLVKVGVDLDAHYI